MNVTCYGYSEEVTMRKRRLLTVLIMAAAIACTMTACGFGDKEDDIAGIPKVGEKTAEKLLDMYGWNVDSVIEIYRDKQVTIDECLKNLLLISPIRKENVIDYRYGLDDSTTLNNILGHFRYWNEKVTEIYSK